MQNLKFAITILLLLVTVPCHAGTDRKQVLYINSYQNGYEWSDNILEGIRQTLRKSRYTVDLQVEYMDAKKHPGPENRALLKQLFTQKFHKTDFDTVICSDNDAFRFMLDNHNELFPDVPVVFCGVNDLQMADLDNQPLFTGVVEKLDIQGNMEIALDFDPGKKRAVVIADPSLTAQAISAQIRKSIPAFKDRLEFEFWDDLSLDQMVKRVRTLPDDTFLFFVPFYVENQGRFLSAAEVINTLYRNASVPIYGAWNFLLDHGIVGGRLLSGQDHGAQAAKMVLEILDGKTPRSIPLATTQPTPPTFDWEVLTRFGLTESLFPQNSRFINRPGATYLLNKRVVWTAALLLAGLMAFTILLGASRSRAVRAERELALSRKMLRSVIDTLPQIIYWKDRQGRYLGVNSRFAQFFGLTSPEEAEGRTGKDFPLDENFPGIGKQADRKVLQSNRPTLQRVAEYQGRPHHGTAFEVNKVPLHDDRGNTTGVLSTAEDVTARLSLERQLIQSQKMEAIGTFVGGIAHDFNNLLTTIINSTELALMDMCHKDAASDVERAHNAARQGSQLVSQILTYTRPSTEGAIMIDPAATVNEALDLVAAMLPENIRFTRNVTPGVARCLADPSQMRQIIMNLCTNAFHAMRQKGGHLHASIVQEHLTEPKPDRAGLEPGRYLRLSIADNGPGIPQDIAARIFDPFFTTKDKSEGTGLGLAIVQGIVRGHGGRVRLSSRPGRTVFDIHLPIRSANVPEDTVSSGPTDGTERVLFVEDSRAQLEVVPRALAKHGYDVSSAEGGHMALDVLTSGLPFDVVVTDYDMPELDGVELARTLEQIFPDLPVVLVSGRKEAAAAAKSAPNIAQILIKPYTGRALARVVRAALDSQDSHDQDTDN